MPRMSEAEKQKSHDRILDAAAELFREQGLDATSVSDVMKRAGMTHGGFYRHFAGKDDLVAAAFERAVDQVVADIEASKDGEERAQARATYIDNYLSADHVTDRQRGCPMAALGSELGRAGGEAAGKTSQAVDRVSALLQHDGIDELAEARLALLVGSITLARLSHDDRRAGAILDSARAAIRRLSPE